jgi:electron transport complex protein RnfC
MMIAKSETKSGMALLVRLNLYRTFTSVYGLLYLIIGMILPIVMSFVFSNSIGRQADVSGIPIIASLIPAILPLFVSVGSIGGACFPTHVKYMIPENKKVDYILVNAAECEPYITIDYRMMIERAEECLVGVNALMIASGAPKALIGIENNKPEAIQHLTKVAAQYPNIEIVPLKTKYPQGAEKQLIKALVNREVPSGKLPIEVGVIVNNITTCHAVYEAVQKNKPLIETFLTVSGKKLSQLKNYQVRLGTPINEILDQVQIPENTGKIISGGPMMGKAISNLATFTVKGMSSILLMDKTESQRGKIENCLRCGKCVQACPMGLEPYLIAPLSEMKDYESCEKNGILDCCECGSCSFSCPSNRPLLDYIRLGKGKTGAMIRARKS